MDCARSPPTECSSAPPSNCSSLSSISSGHPIAPRYTSHLPPNHAPARTPAQALHRLQIDDCVGAFSVHGAVGAYSLIFIAFFAKPAYMKEIYGPSYEARKRFG